MNNNKMSDSQGLDGASSDFLSVDVPQHMVTVGPDGGSVQVPTQQPAPTPTPEPVGGDAVDNGLLSGIDFGGLGTVSQDTNPPQPGAVVPVSADASLPQAQQNRLKWTFAESTYANDEELRRGVDHKDRLIKSHKDELGHKDDEIEQLRVALEQKAQEVEMIAALYGQQAPDEEAQVELFAQALMSEEFQGKTDADFRVNLDDYSVNPDTYKVDPSQYDDEDDLQEAIEKAKKRRLKREKDLERSLREDQARLANEYQRYIQEKERARAQVQSNLQQQRDQVAQQREDRKRLLQEASNSLREEMTEEALGLVNTEDGAIAKDIFYKRPINVRMANGEVVDKTLAEVIVQLRMDYGRPVTDLIIKGVRQEIRGDSPTAVLPVAVTPVTPSNPARPPQSFRNAPQPPTPEAQKSSKMFGDAGWA